jgi:hypothetical protein
MDIVHIYHAATRSIHSWEILLARSGDIYSPLKLTSNFSFGSASLKFDQVIVLLALRDSALDFACNKKKSPSRCSLKLQDINAEASSLGVPCEGRKIFFQWLVECPCVATGKYDMEKYNLFYWTPQAQRLF